MKHHWLWLEFINDSSTFQYTNIHTSNANKSKPFQTLHTLIKQKDKLKTHPFEPPRTWRSKPPSISWKPFSTIRSWWLFQQLDRMILPQPMPPCWQHYVKDVVGCVDIIVTTRRSPFSCNNCNAALLFVTSSVPPSIGTTNNSLRQLLPPPIVVSSYSASAPDTEDDATAESAAVEDFFMLRTNSSHLAGEGDSMHERTERRSRSEREWREGDDDGPLFVSVIGLRDAMCWLLSCTFFGEREVQWSGDTAGGRILLPSC